MAGFHRQLLNCRFNREAAPAAYSLQSVAISGGKGSAVVSAPEDCTLITGFYAERGGKDRMWAETSG